jgi:hypothetical protein
MSALRRWLREERAEQRERVAREGFDRDAERRTRARILRSRGVQCCSVCARRGPQCCVDFGPRDFNAAVTFLGQLVKAPVLVIKEPPCP